MSRKDRYELDIWYSNWRAGWKLQTKDMKFSRSDISSEMSSMEVELEQNKSISLQSCCRLELMKRQNVPK